MRLFDRTLSAQLFEEIVSHARAEYPREACGLIAGPKGSSELTEARAIPNVESQSISFRMDDGERLRFLEDIGQRGLEERVIYHSHPDAGAYFSPEDRAAAVLDGTEVVPNAIHLVLSIRGGELADVAAFRFSKRDGQFEEARPLVDREHLPDIEQRAMKSASVARPVEPVGGRLVQRIVSAEEAEALVALASGRAVRISDTDAVILRLLGAGLLSPLSGFLRSAEIATVESQGRLLGGTPWRVPVVLDVGDVEGLESGDVVTLEHKGSPMGWLAVKEAAGGILAGPVFVKADGQAVRSAVDLRAEILRRGFERVLALPEHWFESRSAADLSSFDGLYAAEVPANCDPSRWLRLPPSSGSEWLDAVVAQNAGATHVWVDNPADARAVRESLRIAPWPTRTVSRVA
ncbi:MAG: Mov34/MPN/PAD-1 family protein [Deltaproteobacteria bacterium]|nr:Mov34/MPN/PAD-1 family protein [Deltaproteobacteria bacterium]